MLRPEWIGAYVNADEIEKSLRATGTLDLADFGLTGDAVMLEQQLRGHLAASGLLRQHSLDGAAQTLRVAEANLLHLPTRWANSYVAAVLADAVRRQLLAQGSTFTFETVMSSSDKIDFMEEARASGYRTYLYFVATDDPAINVARVRLRVEQGGHDVPENKILERYQRSIALLNDACTAANRAYVFDNSGSEHQWIAEIQEGNELTVHASALPAWFTGTTLWQSFQPAADGP
ncbi:Zeta toxin [Paracidovorax konjaci]|uniref:Zeta toxin n=1 Tax=Paracidovorax konjaci TaxID=32040 RepID=A0A1I1RPT4_9BURK|nr:Zeta toxin [Paracidovorax konjaci]